MRIDINEYGDIIKALKLARRYIDSPIDTTLVYKTEAQSLREAADRAEQKEKDIAFIDKILDREINLQFKRKNEK